MRWRSEDITTIVAVAILVIINIIVNITNANTCGPQVRSMDMPNVTGPSRLMEFILPVGKHRALGHVNPAQTLACPPHPRCNVGTGKIYSIRKGVPRGPMINIEAGVRGNEQLDTQGYFAMTKWLPNWQNRFHPQSQFTLPIVTHS